MQVKPEGHTSAISEPQAMRKKDLAVLLFALLLIGIICLGQSGMKRLWYDELITFGIAGLPTLGSILHFFESGKDTTSFLPAMLVHIFQRLPGPIETTTRLPFTLAYLVSCGCFWMFLYRRYGAAFSTAGVFLLAQGWTLYFASEDRAYAFVLAGAAVALLCWQSATDSPRHRGWYIVGVYLALSIAILFHFFAIFLLPPFLIAEYYVYRQSGKVRWGMLLALLLYPLSIIIMLPNMIRARGIYGGTFWSKPSLGLLTDNYSVLLDPIAHNFGELVLIILFSFWAGRRALRAGGSLATYRGFTRAEWVLLVSVSLVPFIAFLGAQKLGVYRTQYVLYFQLAALMVMIGALGETMRQHARAGWVLAAVLLLTLIMHNRDRFQQGLRVLTGRSVTTGMYSEHDPDLEAYLQKQTLPLVVEGSNSLVVLTHYAPLLRGRLTLLTSRQRAAEQSRAMTNELNMEVFGKDLHLATEDFSSFTAAHPDFLLVVNPEQIGFDWLFRSLAQHEVAEGKATMQLIWTANSGQGDEVYRVSLRPGSEAAPQ